MQEEIKNLAAKYDPENLLVILGINQPATIKIMAQTFHSGDPSFAGPLAALALGIKTYHILELKDSIPENIWQSNMGMYELELDEEEQSAILTTMREQRSELS